MSLIKKIYQEGVRCIGFNAHGEVILVKRRDLKVWELPGGGIDPGESLEEAAKREFEEETGLGIIITTYRGPYKISFPHPFPFLYNTYHVYSGQVTGGKIKMNDEVSKIRAFSPYNLPRGLPYYYKSCINDATAGTIHDSPVIQRAGLSHLVRTLAANPQVLLRLPILFRFLTKE